MRELNKEWLDEQVKAMKQKKGVYTGVFSVEHMHTNFSYTGCIGNMEADRPYFIASVTKLYITVVVMTLVNEGRLQLEDKIAKYLPKEWLQALHVYKGTDYSHQITIKQLISNTSGIPDYFFHKQENGRTFSDDLLKGQDIFLTLDETIDYVKQLKPKFAPDTKRKAAYSDTNYQLLGYIIEKVTGEDIGQVFQKMIFDPLRLESTYAYFDTTDREPIPFYYGSKLIWVPEYIASVTAEGGIVSTAKEVMIFLKAFMQGQLIPLEQIKLLKNWRLLLPPPALFYFGIGLEKLYIPRIVSPFKPINDIIGFWGQTGSFAWYHADTGLYFTGTTNQINGSGHAAAMKLMLKTIKQVR